MKREEEEEKEEAEGFEEGGGGGNDWRKRGWRTWVMVWERRVRIRGGALTGKTRAPVSDKINKKDPSEQKIMSLERNERREQAD